MSSSYWTIISQGIPFTLIVTVGAFVFGAVLGAPLCALRSSRLSLLRLAAASTILTLRSIPPIVWIFILYFGMGSEFLSIDPIPAAIIGLGGIAAANMAEIYRGALRSIPQGQRDASAALGLPPWSHFWDVIAPQLLRVAVPSAASYMIGLLKDSAIASTIGVSELAYQANFLARRDFEGGLAIFATAGLLYIVMSLPIAAVARYTDQVLRAKVVP